MDRLYFGHPINTYHTELEARLLRLIAKRWPDHIVVNPSDAIHQQEVQHRHQLGLAPIDYFVNDVVPTCQAGVFLPFLDGAWGAGIYKEAVTLLLLHRKIWQIDASGVIVPVDWANLDPLSVDETRQRLRTTDGTPIPYEA